MARTKGESAKAKKESMGCKQRGSMGKENECDRRYV